MDYADDRNGEQQGMDDDDQSMGLAEYTYIVREIELQPRWRARADKEADYGDGNQLEGELLQRMQQAGIQEAVGVGVPPTPEEMEEAYGVKVDVAALIPPDVALGALTSLNDPDARAVGVPGGGGIMRAADIAQLYQGLLRNTGGLWSEEALVEGTQRLTVFLRLCEYLGFQQQN